MVLLTSGTVSAAISSGIVFLFTSALFLSGYVLQQKTVTSLREQIREPPRPTHTYVYLPPQFANPTPISEPEQSPGQEISNININPEISDYQQIPNAPVAGEEDVLQTDDVRDNAGSGIAGKSVEVPGGRVIAMEVGSQIPLGEDRQDAMKQSVQEDPARSYEGLSRAERRRRIKEDIAESTRKDREGYHRRTY